MKKAANASHDLLPLYRKFISMSHSGRRMQPNGKRISEGTVNNYRQTLKLLEKFSTEKDFPLRLRNIKYLDSRGMRTEANYWDKFYRQFLEFLYKDCGHFDNYAGFTIKNIRTFFNFCNQYLLLNVGTFHKNFYVPKEQPSIIALLPEELNYLIYDKGLHDSLPRRLQEAKDFFVFGCTVGLRFSDLIALKKANLRYIHGQGKFLVVKSKKTATDI